MAIEYLAKYGAQFWKWTKYWNIQSIIKKCYVIELYDTSLLYYIILYKVCTKSSISLEFGEGPYKPQLWRWVLMLLMMLMLFMRTLWLLLFYIILHNSHTNITPALVFIFKLLKVNELKTSQVSKFAFVLVHYY